MSITIREAIFNQWAPADGAWSAWAKPVLFAHLRPHAMRDAGAPAATSSPSPSSSAATTPLATAASSASAPPAATTPAEPLTAPVTREAAASEPPTITLMIARTAWAPPPDGATVIVVDLPSAAGVHLGLALARAGYRPVPLYNAVPSPASVHAPGRLTCEVGAILDAIVRVTPELAALRLRADAPPAFLLDARRSIGTTSASTVPGQRLFDNRSVSLPTDFPSANLLLSRGVRRAILVRQQWLDPQADLAHTLLRWQQAGLIIEAVALEPSADVAGVAGVAPSSTPIVVRRPPLYRVMFQRLLATLGLRRHPLGGFGGLLPEEGWGSGSVG